MELQPGSVIGDGPLKYVVCLLINDLECRVTIPQPIFDQVCSNAGLNPAWPLGVFVVFTSKGVTLGIFGSDHQGLLQCGTSELIKGKILSDLGESLWLLWEKHHNTPESVLEGNLEKTMLQAKSRYEGTS